MGPAFYTGSFLGATVYLGELRTDDAGRLVVLGGRGHSFAPLGDPLTTFANNYGWCDDTSDGPVRATIALLACYTRGQAFLRIRCGRFPWKSGAPQTQPEIVPDGAVWLARTCRKTACRGRMIRALPKRI